MDRTAPGRPPGPSDSAGDTPGGGTLLVWEDWPNQADSGTDRITGWIRREGAGRAAPLVTAPGYQGSAAVTATGYRTGRMAWTSARTERHLPGEDDDRNVLPPGGAAIPRAPEERDPAVPWAIRERCVWEDTRNVPREPGVDLYATPVEYGRSRGSRRVPRVRRPGHAALPPSSRRTEFMSPGRLAQQPWASLGKSRTLGDPDRPGGAAGRWRLPGVGDPYDVLGHRATTAGHSW